MNELALFAGAGGGILGGKLLGWRTVCAVEWEPYPASVLCARQNDKILAPFPIWDDVRTFDGKPWRGIVDVVSGGFPCQDISSAGKGAGITGSRSGLWSEMARIIGEVQPRYAFVENSPMLTSRGLGTVLGDLAALGFDAKWGVVSAADVGAPHLRERIWISAEQRNFLPRANDKGLGWGEQRSESTQETHESMANGNSDSQSISAINAEQVCQSNIPDTDNGRRGRREVSGKGGNGRSEFYGENEQMADPGYERVCQQGISNDVGEDDELPRGIQPDGLSVRGFKEGKDMADPNSAQCKGNEFSVGIIAKHADIGGVCGWSVEPNVGRVANGVAARVDRLKAIGNGQVPRVAATAFKLIVGEF